MRSFWLRGFVLAASTGALVAVSACSHLREAGPGRELSGEVACQPGQACADHTRVGRHPTVHALAHDLDRLEKHIECYGSVTAKVPVVRVVATAGGGPNRGVQPLLGLQVWDGPLVRPPVVRENVRGVGCRLGHRSNGMEQWRIQTFTPWKLKPWNWKDWD